jgi:protease I
MELSGELKGKKIAILVDDLYQDMELWYPAFRFREAGAEVILAGAEAGKSYRSELGYPARADMAYSSLSVREFDGVVIPGGYAPDLIRRYVKANQFVCEMDWERKPVAAISHGAWVLCSAGILRGRRLTCSAAIKDDTIHAGAEYENTGVVVDGNLITACGVEDLPRFGREALAAMSCAAVLV